MAEKLYSYADKQVMDEVGSGGGGGGGSSTLIIHANENNVLDKTWRQIYDHIVSGGSAVIIQADRPEEGLYNITAAVYGTGYYASELSEPDYSIATNLGTYNTNSENGYPAG